MSIRTQLIVGAVVVGVAFTSGWVINGWRYGGKLADIRAEHASVLALQANAVVESVQAARSEENRRTSAVEKERDNAKKLAEVARADAVARTASERRLRQRIDKILADARSVDPAIADGGPTTGTPIDMLAYVLRRSIEASGQLAEYADQARIAGLTCEGAYDGVRNHQAPIQTPKP